MKETRIMMGMPIEVEIVSEKVQEKDFDCVFAYFDYIDQKFSTYKETSEISAINRGELQRESYSHDMQLILELCDKTKKETEGYFDIYHNNKMDPSGLVKGWAIREAARLILKMGFRNYYVDAGGDIQVGGHNKAGGKWMIGIRNPFNRKENVKIIQVGDVGVATSGIYIRGQHVYNPKEPNKKLEDIASLTVIGPDIYEADRMATAALAMGYEGISFIQKLPLFDAYMIDTTGKAWWTTGWDRYATTPQ